MKMKVFIITEEMTITFSDQILRNINYPLTLPAPDISESWIEIKVNLNLYFHTSLWCLKRFYKGLWGLPKAFWGTTKKCENENVS